MLLILILQPVNYYHDSWVWLQRIQTTTGSCKERTNVFMVLYIARRWVGGIGEMNSITKIALFVLHREWATVNDVVVAVSWADVV